MTGFWDSGMRYNMKHVFWMNVTSVENWISSRFTIFKWSLLRIRIDSLSRRFESLYYSNDVTNIFLGVARGSPRISIQIVGSKSLQLYVLCLSIFLQEDMRVEWIFYVLILNDCLLHSTPRILVRSPVQIFRFLLLLLLIFHSFVFANEETICFPIPLFEIQEKAISPNKSLADCVVEKSDVGSSST